MHKGKKRNALKWCHIYFPQAFWESFLSLFARCKTSDVQAFVHRRVSGTKLHELLADGPTQELLLQPPRCFFVFCFLEITKPGQSGGELHNEVVHKTVWRTIWWWPNRGTTATTTMVFILVCNNITRRNKWELWRGTNQATLQLDNISWEWNKTTIEDCQSSKSLNGPNQFKLSLQFVSTTKVKTLTWTRRTGRGGPTYCLTPGVRSSSSCRTAGRTFILSNQKSTKPAWDRLTWHISATSCTSFEEYCRKLAVKTCQSKK